MFRQKWPVIVLAELAIGIVEEQGSFQPLQQPLDPLHRQGVARGIVRRAEEQGPPRIALDLGFQLLKYLFEQSHTLLELLVLLSRLLRHRLHRFELLALNDIELAQDVFGLGTHDAFDLLAHALRGASGVGRRLPKRFL